ncbi:MAG: lipopolysaccharide core heptose(I) kinase RfaP [Desulfobacteraceae bacterium]|nr:lipopolysaccharide core heptose(I) kinase RfaP [Desulfobacteraceae bacterium]
MNDPMVVLPEDWKQYWKIKKAGFKELFNVQGKIFREKDGRRTLRFKFDGKYFFGKFHSGVGWKKIIKNLLQLRKPPVLSAQNEWQAILKLKELNIDTMNLVGYGKKGKNPAAIESFVITEELQDIISLEDYCMDWQSSPPDKTIKQALITKVAQIARTIHENGMNHKDLYICHFLLDISKGINNINPDEIHLFLIDLHRVEIRAKIPFYWRAKDVSAILFSSLDIGLTKQDISLFMKTYHNTTVEKSLSKHKFFWWIVKKRALNLYKREFKKDPPGDWYQAIK